jgi:hypothetical protein
MQMKYEIYQIRNIRETDYAFRSYDEAKDMLKKSDYKFVYTGDEELGLDGLFEKFNISIPCDFEGHSLSVSDVVVLNGTAYYCDFIGWKVLDENKWSD